VPVQHLKGQLLQHQQFPSYIKTIISKAIHDYSR
jgi:hypothetical protein